jgi:hypothetical protein
VGSSDPPASAPSVAGTKDMCTVSGVVIIYCKIVTLSGTITLSIPSCNIFSDTRCAISIQKLKVQEQSLKFYV